MNEETKMLEEELEEELEEVAAEPALEETEEAQETPEGESLEELEARKLLLAGEIASLEGELERRRAETDKAAREYAEFRELYPEADPDNLEVEVREAVEAGVPLAAAYALYEKRMQKRNETAAAHNSANRGASFGSVGKAPESDYFTPDEVRGMTQVEVRANYQKIRQSMKNWH